jgi:hypothetical protein
MVCLGPRHSSSGQSLASHRGGPSSHPFRSYGICGGQSGTGIGFPRVLRFPLPIIIPPNSPSSWSPGAGTIGQFVADVSSWSSWIPPATIRIKKNDVHPFINSFIHLGQFKAAIYRFCTSSFHFKKLKKCRNYLTAQAMGGWVNQIRDLLRGRYF